MTETSSGSALFRDWKRIETAAAANPNFFIVACSALFRDWKRIETFLAANESSRPSGSALFRDWKRIETPLSSMLAWRAAERRSALFRDWKRIETFLGAGSSSHEFSAVPRLEAD